MSVDLEDFYCDLPFSMWDKFESRVETTTNKILELFEKYDTKATFFTLGYIAEKHPELIEKIVSNGHEIASHGYYHTDIRKMTKLDFESDLKKSLSILRKISGESVLGFRAPFFSIEEKNFWALDIIRKYVKYDSSIFPVKTPLYGVPKAPSVIYHPSMGSPLLNNPNSDFIEIPPATLKIPVMGRIPIAGGFYLRFLPISLIKYGIKKMNNSNSIAMCYIHPKDLDPNMPKVPEYSWYYYWRLKSATKKFESLLKNFKFSSVRDLIL
jgi:polysaccharide deacetylase family protein (PEP-CTERM system associated)|tara:strand:+ start:253 stop:1056 length:804 start_codon:yes stop_codon:yes gene_type:complete